MTTTSPPTNNASSSDSLTAPPPQPPPAIPLPHLSVKFGLSTSSNPTGTAPKLTFVTSPAEHLAKNKCTVEEVLVELNTLHAKYKAHEKQILAEKLGAEDKLPDLEENIRLIELLRKKLVEEKAPSVNVRFMASDSLWAEGLVTPPPNPSDGTVCLWLGANTMMEYTYDEAHDLLTRNYEACKALVKSREEDLVFVKNQMTSCEVTISRFYNYQVQLKRMTNV